MRDFVSSRWVSLTGWVACATLVWSISMPYGFPWLTLSWVVLALSTAAVLIGKTSAPSAAQVISGVEAEPFKRRKKL
jgi:hypothetical protein